MPLIRGPNVSTSRPSRRYAELSAMAARIRLSAGGTIGGGDVARAGRPGGLTQRGGRGREQHEAEDGRDAAKAHGSLKIEGSLMIVGDEVVFGEAGRQLGHPALGKVASHSRERRGGV